MSVRTLLAVLPFWVAFHTPAVGSCSLESFGKVKADSCSSIECRSSNVPKEIADIMRGIYSEYIGLFINDGNARWIGLDLERLPTLVEVRRFAGKQFSSAQKELRTLKQSASNYGREMSEGTSKMIELIRKKAVGSSRIPDVICDANSLWAKARDPELPFVNMSDSHNKLYLLDRGEVKVFGGPGELRESARKMRDRIDAEMKK